MPFELSFQMILPDIKWYTISINLRHQKRPQEVAIRRREHKWKKEQKANNDPQIYTQKAKDWVTQIQK